MKLAQILGAHTGKNQKVLNRNYIIMANRAVARSAKSALALTKIWREVFASTGR